MCDRARSVRLIPWRDRRARWRLRAALFLGVGLALTGASLVAYGANLFRQLEVDSRRARFQIRGETKPPPELVIVDIDTDTLTQLRETWPFRRRHHARVIDRLRSDGARAIACDIQFTEPTEDVEDNLLIEAVDPLVGAGAAALLYDYRYLRPLAPVPPGPAEKGSKSLARA